MARSKNPDHGFGLSGCAVPGQACLMMKCLFCVGTRVALRADFRVWVRTSESESNHGIVRNAESCVFVGLVTLVP